jgi:DNA-binding response OmpR family regulator
MNEYSIFYADDDEDDLLFFEEAVTSLMGEGAKKINLHLLKNGENLLETLSQKNTINNVVFMDLNMPIKSGFDHLREIRSNNAISLTPVIMYSTSSNEENIMKSRDMGANYYAVKPSSFKDLLKIISKAVSLDFSADTAPPNDFLFNKLAV